MKKTLAAVAILGAFAASASADVTVYGRVDMGVRFTGVEGQYTDAAKKDVRTNAEKFTMESGNASASRIGIKGSEKLSEKTTVGFVLENGFTADNGAENTKMFDRESRLYVATEYGTLSMGRMGVLSVDGNYSGIMSGIQNVAGSGNNSQGKGTDLFVHELGARADNVITYASPVMAGAQVWAQYITGADNATENKQESEKYAGLGVTYKVGAFQTGMVVGKYMNEDQDNDTLTVDVGANYDFGVAKVFAGAQYFKDANDIGISSISAAADAINSAYDLEGDDVIKNDIYDLDGYGLTVSAAVPAFGGEFTTQFTYVDGESDEAEVDVKAYNVGARYKYDLSKSTYLYVGAQFTNEEVKAADAAKFERDTFIATTGMVHVF